jgi:hypothetical protein
MAVAVYEKLDAVIVAKNLYVLLAFRPALDHSLASNATMFKVSTPVLSECEGSRSLAGLGTSFEL